MQWNLLHSHPQNRLNVAVIGIGGTGAFVAESLCRLFTGTKATISLIDHDVVEPHNLLRQNFEPDDVGAYKAQTLATRLSRKFNRPINYSLLPCIESANADSMHGPHLAPHLMIGCVDNAAARAAMANAMQANYHNWLIDAGNGETWGQILIGNAAANDQSHYWFSRQTQTCHRLPLPTIQAPDLLTDTPNLPTSDCAAAIELTDQDPTINSLMAALVVQTVRRILAGTCNYMALHVDQDTATVTPTYATPQNAVRYLPRIRDPDQLVY